jgi:uncharacterized protein YecA (UPF0149 family)
LPLEILWLLNNTSQWALKGHTPYQLSQKENKRLNPLKAEPFKNGKQDSKVINLSTRRKVGRNDSCPCGSGKKYQNYCGS